VTEPEGSKKESMERQECASSTFARQFVADPKMPADPWAGITDEHGSPDVDKLLERQADAVLRTGADGSGDPIVAIDPAKVIDVLTFLRDECGFAMLTDLTAVDYPEEDDRFVVVYILTRLPDGNTMRVKAFLPEEAPEIESVVPLFPAADWLERETFDMYGVRFANHPNLVRILMPESYPHHPLRKEFPVTGDLVMRD
jgi:NADH-quinone oxidoreductase subunit C